MNQRLLIGLALCATAAICLTAGIPAFAQGHPAGARPVRGVERSNPAQPAVALKAEQFLTVSSASPSVKAALPANDLAAAGKLIGKKGAFQGTVVQLYSPRAHDIAILDFAKNYRSALTGIVKPANYAKLPNLQSLVGKHVLVVGTYSAYEGRPQIEIMQPAQVKIIR